jgi:AraC family transcriptional regulator
MRRSKEAHARHALAFVRRGSFGCCAHGRRQELAAGGFFVGYPGDAYTCTHEHHDGGDERLAFLIDPDGNNIEAVCMAEK